MSGEGGAIAEVLHRAFHDAWPGPSQSLDLYADSPIWRAQADALADLLAAERQRGLADVPAAAEGERGEPAEWADWIEHCTQYVGCEWDATTALSIARALRGPKPFGAAANEAAP